jgi:hypothetical protein
MASNLTVCYVGVRVKAYHNFTSGKEYLQEAKRRRAREYA